MIAMARKETPAETERPASFEKGIEELEGVVKELESGDLPLERALQLYERGVQLTDACRKQLQEAETRVEILSKRGSAVEPGPFGN